MWSGSTAMELDDLRWLGLGLQVVGSGAAMVLLVRLREKVTGRDFAARIWWRRFWSWVRRVLRISKSRTAYTGAVFTAGATARALGRVTSGEMPKDSTDSERINWLYDQFRNLEQRHNALFDEVGREATDREKAVGEVRAAIREAVEDARRDFRTLVGADLGWEIFAVLLILAGTVLTAVAA
jgi:hypothetical protein